MEYSHKRRSAEEGWGREKDFNVAPKTSAVVNANHLPAVQNLIGLDHVPGARKKNLKLLDQFEVCSLDRSLVVFFVFDACVSPVRRRHLPPVRYKFYQNYVYVTVSCQFTHTDKESL